MSLVPPVMPAQAISPAQAVRPAAPVELPPAQRIDAFSQSLTQTDSLALNPDRIGKSIGAELHGFTAQETQFRANVAQASVADATPATQPVSFNDMMAQAQALQRKSMGVMMQTYDFALEATLVTNAATTFTSSVNTLIKTQ